MTNADVQPVEHARNGEDHQRYPDAAPVQFHAGGNCGELRSSARLNDQGNCNSQRQQQQKCEW